MTAAGPTVVPRVHTGGSSLQAWEASRLAMLREETAKALAWPEAAGLLAPLFTIHCRVETGGGRVEHNYNLGNRRSFATSKGFAFERSGYLWTAYATLRQGARGYLQTMLHNPRRRAACFAFLTDLDAAAWYSRIIATEYGGDEASHRTLVSLWEAALDRA